MLTAPTPCVSSSVIPSPAAPSLPLGAFVWTNFPFGQPPAARSRPGPTPHIAYYLGSQGALILLAYTSSGPWRGGDPLPPGVVTFDSDEAAALNQRIFHSDMRTLAMVALTPAWFPRFADRDRGIVAVANNSVQRRILEAGRALAGRKETVEILGIGSDVITTRKHR